MELSGSHRRRRRMRSSFGKSDKGHARAFREPSDVSRDHDGIDMPLGDRNREHGDGDMESRETFLQLGGAGTALAPPDQWPGEADR